MPEPASPPRAALYVDFDNVFMALLRWDERAAYAFGERPDAWLAWLEGRAEGGAPVTRRTLIRRCYLNPGGFFDFQMGRPVARYRAARDLRNRTWFGEFRGAFVQAGFDVVDCPPVAHLKNAADMKMALDIREALDHPTRFDEFVLLSGDSDFLPALARLRAHDRRITILAQNTAKPAYLAAADLVVGLDDFAHEGMGNLPIAQFGNPGPVASGPVASGPVVSGPVASGPFAAGPFASSPFASSPFASSPIIAHQAPPRAEPARGQDLNGLREAALAWLREAVSRSPAGALRLTEVGAAIGRALPALRNTAYAGAGSLGSLIEEARDPKLSLSGPPDRRWVYDADRGVPPGDLPPGIEDVPGTGEPEEEPPFVEAESAGPVEPDAEAAPESARPEPEAEPEPKPEPEPAPEPGPTREALMAEAAQLVRDLLWGSRDGRNLAQDLPAFSPAEIGFVLGAIAVRQPIENGDHASLALTIAAEAAAQGHHLSAREVTAVLRWLGRGYAKLTEPGTPDGAARLTRVLFATLVNALRAVDEQLSEAEKDSLRAWTQGGVTEGGVTEG